jgi:hypothetical protein
MENLQDALAEANRLRDTHKVDLARAEREGTDMATIRARQIEAIAGIMRERDEALLAYGGAGLTYEDAQETNRAGWTVDLSPVATLDRRERATSEDRVIRHAGVVLTDDELRRAWDLARRTGV